MENKAYTNRQQGQTGKSTVAMLPDYLQKRLRNSWAAAFNQVCYRRLDNRVLTYFFSPNDCSNRVPLDVYFGLEIMKLLFDWSDDQLLTNFHFDLRVAFAVGQESLGTTQITPQSLSALRKQVLNFVQKVPLTLSKAGIFNRITKREIAAMKIQTKTQQIDFSSIYDNIKNIEKLETALRTLKNFYEELKAEEQLWYYPYVQSYVRADVSKTIARFKASEIEEQTKKVLAILYYFNIIYYNHDEISKMPTFLEIRKLLFKEFNIPRNGKTKHVQEPE